MDKSKITIDNIPAIIWGDNSEKVYLYVHGKSGNKEEAVDLAKVANQKGFQTLSFDLAEHGERVNENYSNNIWNAIQDLNMIAEYANNKWAELNLCAVSIGAFYSLVAYNTLSLRNCLFVSPILDMKKLIETMMIWSGVDEKILEQKKIIKTNFGEVLDWEYYKYVKEHPITHWEPISHILYGMKDNLTNFDTIMDFIKKFDGELSTWASMEHYLHTEEDLKILREWYSKNL